jgi:hypothetical protein
VRQVGVGDSQVLDHLARLRNGSLFLQQRPLQTIDVVREAARSSPLRLEILESFLLGLRYSTPSNLALHALHLYLLIGLSGRGKIGLEEVLTPEVANGYTASVR